MRTPTASHPDTAVHGPDSRHGSAPLRFWLGCALFAAGTLIGGGDSLRWLGRLA